MNPVMRLTGGVSEPTLSSLFEGEVEGVFGFLVRRCGDRSVAEDLTAETFAEASSRFSAGRGHEVTPGWLRTVARRRLIDHWRRGESARRRLVRLASTAPRSAPPPDDPDDAIDDALASLSIRQRAALTLRYLDDYSVAEVAAALGISYKATESLLSRARHSFAESYEEGHD